MNKRTALLLILSLLVSSCTTAAPPREAAQPALTETVSAPVTPAPTKIVESPVPASPAITVAPSPTLKPAPTETAPAAKIEDVIEYELKGAFDFFWEQANTTEGSPGYGLVRDRYPGSPGIASMAAVGFGLTAYPIGVEKGYISKEEGQERVSRTLDTLIKMDRQEGFYYHFVDLETGKRAWESEVSSIDTSILLMGVLTAGQYFGGEIAAKAQEIYDGVNWPWFLDPERDMFYMAYRPEKGFEGHWDFYAEQLMMYVLAAGSDTHPIDDSPYYAFTRHSANYGQGNPFIHSWFGSLFTYQFSHAWIDFRGYTDSKGVSWFDNSVEAARSQVAFAVANDEKYKTLGPDAWGLTACDGPDGYNGLYGAPPSGFDNRQHVVDDTIPPYGAIASILFVPEEAQQAMLNYFTYERLKGEYGFQDAYNLTEDWFGSDVIGIDKGVSLLMLANYKNNLVYQIVMGNKNILRGLERLEIVKST